MIPVWGTPGKFWAMQYLGQTGDGDNAEIKLTQTETGMAMSLALMQLSTLKAPLI